jgi:outer membrane lipoprotein-sorting protein
MIHLKPKKKMKRLLFAQIGLILSLAISAQSLEEITKKNYEASKQEAYDKAETVNITMKAFQQGMEMSMNMLTKKPDKVRTTITVQGMEIVTAYDGTKGWMINPLTGSSTPVEMPASDAAALKNQNNFTSQLTTLFKENRLELLGDQNVNGKPAWKIKATMPTGDISNVYIDKGSFLQVKADTRVAQMGMEMDVETYMTDYTDFGGILMPKTITVYSNGTEMMVMMIEKIEVNKPVDDKMFTLK